MKTTSPSRCMFHIILCSWSLYMYCPSGSIYPGISVLSGLNLPVPLGIILSSGLQLLIQGFIFFSGLYPTIFMGFIFLTGLHLLSSFTPSNLSGLNPAMIIIFLGYIFPSGLYLPILLDFLSSLCSAS